MLLPVLSLFMMVLILDPPSRKIIFPPAPLALISATTGNIQTPKAGALNSKDSLSGASEAHKGEAVEQEARHFVSGLASVAISTAAGKGPGDDGNGNAIGGGETEAESVDNPVSSIEGAMPDPVSVAAGATEAKDLASGDGPTADPAKQPVETAMWDKARPIMRGISDAADGWERLGKYVLTPYSMSLVVLIVVQCSFTHTPIPLWDSATQTRRLHASHGSHNLLRRCSIRATCHYISRRIWLFWTTNDCTRGSLAHAQGPQLAGIPGITSVRVVMFT